MRRVATALLVAAACTCGGGDGPREQLLATIERLIELHDEGAGSASVARVEELTGVELAAVEDDGNPYFATHRGRDEDGPISEVELRVASSAEARRGQILILTVGDDVLVTKQEIETAYGEGPDFTVPSPHAPPGAPAYDNYRFPWGRLSFGFTRGEGRLTTVVFDTVPE
jgi:hypothetical protein